MKLLNNKEIKKYFYTPSKVFLKVYLNNEIFY